MKQKHDNPSDERQAILRHVKRQMRNHGPASVTYAVLGKIVVWIARRDARTSARPGGIGRKVKA